MRKLLFVGLVELLAAGCSYSQTLSRPQQVRAENQPVADLGNGWYRNPILAGNYGDPTVVKVGGDYYMAFSRGNGFILWHSRDVVNWRPVIRQTFKEISGIWAIDIQYFDGKFHIYMPAGEYPGREEEEKERHFYRVNYVTTAVRPEGPWSEPVRVDHEQIADTFYTGIDPGFIRTPEGKKFLYVDHGYVMPLSEDGLKATGMPRIVYEGWDYPADWVVEGNCLESPKLFLRDGWYYLVSAMGGTSGPSTAHMAVTARSKSPTGPWENSPYNPLVRTYSESETWWQQGHATIFEGPDGSWWTVYHARLNNYTGMGRQTLLLPVEWTADGWPVIKNGWKSSEMIPMPKGGENVGHGMPISDDFTAGGLGIQWMYDPEQQERFQCGSGKLVMEAPGRDDRSATSCSVMAVNKSYEAVVEVRCPEGVTAGLTFGNGEGLKTDGKKVSYNKGEIWRTRNTDMKLKKEGRVFLKIRNNRQDLSFFASEDGTEWVPFQNGVRSGNYTITLYAAGKGSAVFRGFQYRGLE